MALVVAPDNLGPLSPALSLSVFSSAEKRVLYPAEVERLTGVLSFTPRYESTLCLPLFLPGYNLLFEIPLVSFLAHFKRQYARHAFPIGSAYLAGSLANQHILHGEAKGRSDCDFAFEVAIPSFSRWQDIEHLFLACLAKCAGIYYVDGAAQDGSTRRYYYNKEAQCILFITKDSTQDAYPVDFGDGKNYCGQFFKLYGGLKNYLAITPNEQQPKENHLLLSIPTDQGGVDFYFVADSAHLCFSSAEGGWICLDSVIDACNTCRNTREFEEYLKKNPVTVRTVDGYTLEEMQKSGLQKRFKVNHPEELRDAFKIYVYRELKGYTPWDPHLVLALGESFIGEFFDCQAERLLPQWSLKPGRNQTKLETTLRNFIASKPFFTEEPKHKITYLLAYSALLSKLERMPESSLSKLPLSTRATLYTLLGKLIIEFLGHKNSEDDACMLYFMEMCKMHYSFASAQVQSNADSLFDGLITLHEGETGVFQSHKVVLIKLLEAFQKFLPLPIDLVNPLEGYRERSAPSIDPSVVTRVLQRDLRPVSRWIQIYPLLLRVVQGDEMKIGEYVLPLLESNPPFDTEEEKKEVVERGLACLQHMLLKFHPQAPRLLSVLRRYLSHAQREQLILLMEEELNKCDERTPHFQKDYLFGISCDLLNGPFSAPGLRLFKVLFKTFYQEAKKSKVLEGVLRFFCESSPTFLGDESHVVEAILEANYEEGTTFLESVANFFKKETYISLIDAFIARFSPAPTMPAVFLRGCDLHKKCVVKGNIPFIKIRELYNKLSLSPLKTHVKYMRELYALLHFAAHSKGEFFQGYIELFEAHLKELSNQIEHLSAQQKKDVEDFLKEIREKILMLSEKYQGAKYKQQEHLCIQRLITAYLELLLAHTQNDSFCQGLLKRVFTDLNNHVFFKSRPLIWVGPYLKYLFLKNTGSPLAMLNDYSEKEPVIEQLPMKDFFPLFKLFLERVASYKGQKVEQIIKKGIGRIQSSDLSGVEDLSATLKETVEALSPHIPYLALTSPTKEALVSFREFLKAHGVTGEDGAFASLTPVPASSIAASSATPSVLRELTSGSVEAESFHSLGIPELSEGFLLLAETCDEEFFQKSQQKLHAHSEGLKEKRDYSSNIPEGKVFVEKCLGASYEMHFKFLVTYIQRHLNFKDVDLTLALHYAMTLFEEATLFFESAGVTNYSLEDSALKLHPVTAWEKFAACVIQNLYAFGYVRQKLEAMYEKHPSLFLQGIRIYQSLLQYGMQHTYPFEERPQAFRECYALFKNMHALYKIAEKERIKGHIDIDKLGKALLFEGAELMRSTQDAGIQLAMSDLALLLGHSLKSVEGTKGKPLNFKTLIVTKGKSRVLPKRGNHSPQVQASSASASSPKGRSSEPDITTLTKLQKHIAFLESKKVAESLAPAAKEQIAYELIQADTPITSLDQIGLILTYLLQSHIKPKQNAVLAGTGVRTGAFFEQFPAVSERILTYLGNTVHDPIDVFTILTTVEKFLIDAEKRGTLNEGEETPADKLYLYRVTLYRFHFKFLLCCHKKLENTDMRFDLDNVFTLIKNVYQESCVGATRIPVEERSFQQGEVVEVCNSFASTRIFHPVSFHMFLMQTDTLFKTLGFSPVATLQRNFTAIEQMRNNLSPINAPFFFKITVELLKDSMRISESSENKDFPSLSSYFLLAYEFFLCGIDFIKEEVKVLEPVLKLGALLSCTSATKTLFAWYKNEGKEHEEAIMTKIATRIEELKGFVTNPNQKQSIDLIKITARGRLKSVELAQEKSGSSLL